MTVSSVAASDNENSNVYIRQLVNEMENSLDNTDFNKFDADAQKFIKSIENMSDAKKDFLKLFFFSERLLWRVYDDYVAILEQKSQETGRKVIKSDYSGTVSARLDNTGVSDDNCVLTENLCDYPDGYEDCLIDLKDPDDAESMTYQLLIKCDDKKSNKVNSIGITININQSENSGSLLVRFSGDESKYDENVKYRQQEVEIKRFNVKQKNANARKPFPDMPESEVYGVNFMKMYNVGS